jgi:outer membrane receptor for ferrienterochelin and colicins
MKNLFAFCLLLLISATTFSQKKSDSNIIGHVVNGNEHIPFASLVIKGTTIGTATDETGHYRMINVPVGKYTLEAKAIGYRSQQVEFTISAGETLELNFELDEDAIGLDEVVVTADRNEQRRKETSTIVKTISPKLFNMTQSVTLGDGLNFSPGLRLENNCSNCGFTQLRMNGLEGPYTQILINSRPIFSGLAGVYGLELIPSNMIERVEVIRGGGSALYGSNAIAGTVNLILKDPINNSFEMGLNSSHSGLGMNNTGGITPDYSANFNSSVVTSDLKTGLAVYGFTRNRKPFDANNDGFSELTSLENTSIGARVFHRFGTRSKIAVDYFNITEKRRGGDRFDLPLHESNVSEAVEHSINTGAITFDRFFRSIDILSVFASVQMVDRDSYYGAGKSLKDYGKTKDLTYAIGSQYSYNMSNSSLIVGIENTGGKLNDIKLGYPDIENAVIENGAIVSIPHTENTTVADQSIYITGAFTQFEHRYKKLKTTLGARFDNYQIDYKDGFTSSISNNVLSPRISLMYSATHHLQARFSYAQGYRAPQVFDEDLHILTSAARQVIHKNDPNLKQESSHSFMGSIDYENSLGSVFFNILAEGFYTQLLNPFQNEYGEPDENGTVIYTRVNANDGASVAGVNLEFNVIPASGWLFNAAFTYQNSIFKVAQEFDERRFFRTPNIYGYFTLDWQANKKLGFSTTGTYTGKMLIPYFGQQLANPDDGELRESTPFTDLGLKIRYNVKVNGATLQVFGGVKNMLNAYQSDLDLGDERDPGYTYGPSLPRTVYFGIRIGNMLK